MTKEFSHLMYRAYIRDGDRIHTGEALLLACLLHAKGNNRARGNGKDLEDVQRIMKDVNIRTGAGKRH